MNAALLSLAPAFAACLMKTIGATLRVHVVRGEIEQALHARRPNVIYAFWHGHLLYLMYRYRGSGVYILVSQSRDGEVLSRILQRFGLPVIRGSSSRGGRRSLLELVRRARAGASAAIAPDGPRGPRHQAQSGIITLARLTEIPIIPELGSLAPTPAQQSRGRVLWRASSGAVRCRRGIARAEAARAGG
jgi:lysophospholipid acyltransferase (LPLAT)-like uncharacterized protein